MGPRHELLPEQAQEDPAMMKTVAAAALAALAAACATANPGPAFGPFPYATLQEFEAAASEHGQIGCREGRPDAHYVKTSEASGIYLYSARGRFAAVAADVADGPSGIPTYVWLGRVLDRGVLETVEHGPYSMEEHGNSPCPYLYQSGAEPVPQESFPAPAPDPGNGFCTPERALLMPDVPTMEIYGQGGCI